jgi:hypothetical protein
MKLLTAIVLSSFLFSSCETPLPKKNESGLTRKGESQSSHDAGIWENDTYVDELGQTSERDYISNRVFITGRFSNTATPHSPLNVKFRIFGPNNISLQLFEYAGNNPVKALSPESYTVAIRDADGVQHKLKAINYSDRLAFEKTDAKTVHEILMKGGNIQFNISGEFKTKTQYQFTIDNASGYDEAYKNLSGK